MFQWYQKNLKKYERVLFGVLLAVIVIAFVLSGVAGQVGGDGDPARKDFVVETPLQNFSRLEFDSLVFRWKKALMGRGNMFLSFLLAHGPQIYAGDMTKNPYAYMLGGGDTRTMDREMAADICVILGAARQHEMRVTDEEIRQEVKDALSFGAGLDMEKYTAILGQMELTAEDYEKTMGEFMLVERYLGTLLSGVSVATEDVFNEFMKTGGRAKAKYVYFDDTKFRKRAESKVSQRTLTEYLRAFKGSIGFRKEAQARLEFIRVTLEPLIAAIKDDPTEAELQKYYDAHKGEFRRVYATCALPPQEYLFVPATMVDHKHDGHDHDVHDDTEEGTEIEDPYKPFKDVRKQLIEKVKAQMAADQAAITMGKVKDRVFELRMQGVAKPSFLELAKEFGLDPPGTSVFFEEDDVKPLDEQLGIPKAGSPQWYTFYNEKVDTARAASVKTDKADLMVRLIEKTEVQPYLFTSHVRAKGVTKCAERDAGMLVRKEAEALQKEFLSRYDKVYGDRMIRGDKLTDEEIAAIRFDSFTTLCADRKLDVKETEFVSRTDTVAEIPDSRQFLQTLFEIEARGDVKVSYGNSGQSLVELMEKRPPRADDFMTKRKQLEQQLLRQKQGRFLTEMLAEFRKLCKVKIDEEKKK
ncbi:MAG: hypothetical protein FD180_4414 [Planctomycetota bacterium]|nr:MAG: hypothetical protein FD180_4414 [Planctomycetota bacterium]